MSATACGLVLNAPQTTDNVLHNCSELNQPKNQSEKAAKTKDCNISSYVTDSCKMSLQIQREKIAFCLYPSPFFLFFISFPSSSRIPFIRRSYRYFSPTFSFPVSHPYLFFSRFFGISFPFFDISENKLHEAQSFLRS